MNDNTTEIKRKFFNSLKRGTGEALLILQENSTIDFSDLIIKGATVNFAFDPQCEGSRATYIYRLFAKSKQKDKILNEVLKTLQQQQSDYWALDQMCDLAVLFFKAGYPEAKAAIHNRFEKNSIEGFEFCGQDQLMKIDGLNGLLKVAEYVGKKIYEENDWEDSWHVDNFQKKNKSLAIYDELKKASKKNKFINAYYNSILENKSKLSRSRKFTTFSYELIKEKIAADKFRAISTERANDLSNEEVERLANDFLNEKDKLKQERYLRFFGKRKFPYDYHSLLKIASGKNYRKSRLIEYAVEALKYFRGMDIRQLALQKLRTEKNAYNYINLLVGNYQNGDYKLLSEIANRSNSYEYIHSIVSGFVDVYEANSVKECKEPLEIVYNKLNCGLCRKNIVKVLIENKVLSEQIQQELKFDSYDEIRKLYSASKKNGR